MLLRNSIKSLLGSVVLMTAFSVQATESVPIQFKDGDVISAEVVNSLLGRLNDVQFGFSSINQINGTWKCKIYSAYSVPSETSCIADGSLLFTKDTTLIFDSVNKTYTYISPNGADGWASQPFRDCLKTKPLIYITVESASSRLLADRTRWKPAPHKISSCKFSCDGLRIRS